VMTPLPKRT